MCGADKFSVKFGNDKTDCFCCAGAVGNDVHGSCASAAEVALAMRSVKNHLVAGVSVNGNHNARFDGSEVVKGFCHRSEAVGGAACGGDDIVVFIERFVVYVVNDCGKVVACGSGNNDFLCDCGDMSLRFRFAGIETGAFENNVYVKGFPRKVSGVLLCVNGDFLAIDNDVAVFFNGAVLVKNSFCAFNLVAVCIVTLG